MLLYFVNVSNMENKEFQKLISSVRSDGTVSDAWHSDDDIKKNVRVRFLPDDSGVYRPYELVAFPGKTFIPPGWESSSSGKKNGKSSTDDNEFFDSLEASEFSRMENRRKSFSRARNMLFNISLSTLCFDCFVTLTLDSAVIDRYDYSKVIHRLSLIHI